MTSHGINGNSESVSFQELVVGLYAGNDNTNIDDIYNIDKSTIICLNDWTVEFGQTI